MEGMTLQGHSLLQGQLEWMSGNGMMLYNMCSAAAQATDCAAGRNPGSTARCVRTNSSHTAFPVEQGQQKTLAARTTSFVPSLATHLASSLCDDDGEWYVAADCDQHNASNPQLHAHGQVRAGNKHINHLRYHIEQHNGHRVLQQQQQQQHNLADVA